MIFSTALLFLTQEESVTGHTVNASLPAVSTILPQRVEKSLEVAPSPQNVSAALKTACPELVATSSAILKTATVSRGGEISPPTSEEEEVPVEDGAEAPTTSTGKGWNFCLTLVCIFCGYLTSLSPCCFRSLCVSL